MTIYSISLLLTFMYLVGEHLYSLYKKDGIYPRNESFSNYFTWAGINLLSKTTTPFHFIFLFSVFSVLNYSYKHTTLFTLIACLLLVDFSYYVLHRLKHTYAFLWATHHVHHSGKAFNMSTYLRTSWVEHAYLLSAPLIPAVIAGFNPSTVISVSMFLLIYQFYCHSNYLINILPRWLDLIFITPHLHSIHHDENKKNYNSNFGVCFSFWDSIFNTLTKEITTFTPGIKEYKQENVFKIQLDPLREYLKTWQK
jgi:sterol desaturase/sphingolipid hydroxylase (fatty acid hydroxylase superfamily)